jgi:membrane associated rhomboid family serine protease
VQVHARAWEQPVWKPVATYGLMIAMVSTFFLQNAFPDGRLWLIWTDWPTRPWSLVTSTFAHGGLMHLFINGLMLYFFGPTLERLVGRRDFVALFILTGAAAGILQVELSAQYGLGLPALGASGAIMAIFGTMAILWPHQKILIYGIIPVKFWMAAVGYAALDVLGTFNANNGIGNYAHLSGMLLGLAFGLGLKENLKRRMVQRFGR